ncbi:MAG: hypothetical protein O7I42_01380 [Alphaproteobacteria bacterium]|nr:hypothetical protein [Alphaproteobacteria bacterium]
MSAKKLDAIRDKIAALVGQRDEIADAPLQRGEAEVHIDGVLRAVHIHPILGPSPAGVRDGSFDTTELEKLLGKPGLLIKLLREPLKAYLLQVFDAEAGDAMGLPSGERRKKLTELDGRLYQLEQEEERLIELLEDQGADVIRRPDANPAAALGLSYKAA